MTGSNVGQAREDPLLLATKLYIPRARPTLLYRPRLLARLNAGLHGPLTLISAPTGSGKTALLTDWLRQGIRDRSLTAHSSELETQNVEVAWFSLDSDDDDLAQFLRYLVAASQALLPPAGAALLSLLHPGLAQLPPVPVLMTSLINDLARVPAHSILVLDDYHVVSDDRIHEAITFLLDHLPPQLHVVITTRIDPPLPLTRWRAHGLLTELRAADLRFTVEEATAFLTEVMRLPLSTAAVQALEERTEGWIAGLQFAALAMRDRVDLQGFVNAFTGSHRFVLDYLVDEVLLRQPPHRQRFLLQTAILERMCGSLCDAVMGVGDAGSAYSQTLLEELEQANLFVVPLDDTREWYRYHHLFADVLRHRLRNGASPGEVRTLHARAAAWHEQHGLIEEAIHHSLQAADYERYARIVERVGHQLGSRGEFGLLRRWLAQLPAEMLTTRPELSLISAWALSFTADLDAVVARLDDVERLLAGASVEAQAIPVRNQLEGELLAIRGFVAFRQQQIPEAIALMQQAQPRIPEQNVHMRGMNLHHLGLAYRLSRDLVAAEPAFAEAAAIFATSADTRTFALYPLRNLGMIEEARGRLRRAEQTYRRALELGFAGGRPLPLASYVYVCLGRIHYEWNDLPTAASYLRQAIELGSQAGLDQIITEALIELAPVLQAQGAGDEVDAVLQQGHDAARRWNDPGLVARAAATAARVRLLQGKLADAIRWAEEAGIEVEELGGFEFSHLTFARLLLAWGRLEDARQFLERLVVYADAGAQLRTALEALALLAVARHNAGDDLGALAALKRALVLAKPQGYIRTFLDVGSGLGDLIEKGLARSDWISGDDDHDGGVQSYAETLLESFPLRPAAAVSAPPSGAPAVLPSLVDSLTPRELEVLRLIAAGKSNGEIAATMVVAVSTVKAHINSIFGKLGVTSRTQALVRARELRIL